MRIELNSGGLGGSAIISGFQTDFSSLISKSRRVVSSFQVVKTFSNHMNGGIGSLQNAVDQIDSRMQQEEAKADALKTAQKKSEDFLELVHTIDEKVSILVNRNKHDFYDKNPWAKPPQEDNVKKYCDKIKDYVCKNIEKLKEGLKNIAKTVIKLNKDVIDTVSKAWDNVKNWCNEHKDAIKKIAIAVGVIVILGVAAALTAGTAAVALAGILDLAFKGALIGGAVGAATSAGVSAWEYGKENGTLKGASGAIFDSAADGFLSGTITGAATGAASQVGTTLMTAANVSKGAAITTQVLAGGTFNGVGEAGVTALDYYFDNGTLKGSGEKVMKSFAVNFAFGCGTQIGSIRGTAMKNAIASNIRNRISNNTASGFERFIANNKFTYKTFESAAKNPWYSSRADAQSALFKGLSEYSDLTKAIEKKLFDKFKDNIKGNFNIQDPSSIIKNKLLGT